MLTDEARRGHLSTFLQPYGCDIDDLAGEVDTSFGTPLLVVAAGSVLQGFGNPASDVDLHVVVADQRVTDFPVSSHRLGPPVDVNYLAAETLRAAVAEIERDWTASLDDRTGWRRARQRLIRLSRTAQGLPLSGEPEWLAWQRHLRELFPGHCVAWHRRETLRQRTAARLLYDRKPLLASQRYCDAALAALDASAADAGEVDVGTKWLGLKLARLGRDDLVAVHTALLDTPITAAETGAYRDRVEGLLTELTADWPLPERPALVLSPGQGYEVWPAQDRVLAHRSGLRGVELARPVELPWTGTADALDAELRALVEQDLVWLSVREAGS